MSHTLVDATTNQTAKKMETVSQNGRHALVSRFRKTEYTKLFKKEESKTEMTYPERVNKIANEISQKFGGDRDLKERLVRALSWGGHKEVTRMVERQLYRSIDNRKNKTRTANQLVWMFTTGNLRKVIAEAKKKQEIVKYFADLHLGQRTFTTTVLAEKAANVLVKYIDKPEVVEQFIQRFAILARSRKEITLLSILEYMEDHSDDSKKARKYLNEKLRELNMEGMFN